MKNRKMKGQWNVSNIEPKFSSTKPAAAIIRDVLGVIVLSSLLLIAALPVQAQTETVLYNFTGGSDGGHPQSRLTFDSAGNLYGTTLLGGVATIDNNLGSGVVFELSPNGTGGWNETVLHAFDGGLNVGPDGANPSGPVIFDRVGNLCGTTLYGGADFGYCSYGTIFQLSPAPGSWTETTLFSQSCTQYDGDFPSNGVVMDAVGNLYGTNSAGVFELSPSPGGWTQEIIYGTSPNGGLTMDAAGNIYGVTDSTVFELSSNGAGGWNPSVLYTFPGTPKDGASASGTPAFDPVGNLYGTTYAGGTYSHGTVYKLTRTESGEWTEQILYSFTADKGGSNPAAGVVLDPAGNLYGTTVLGGTKNKGQGTVFELANLSNSQYEYTVLVTFNGKNGANPYGSLILDEAGHLYGTASGGGSSNAGVVFEVTGVRATTAATLWSSPNPSTYGEAVTFTAVVTPVPPDGEVVSFMKGKTKTVLGTGSLSGGSANFTTATLPLGGTSVEAVYPGDKDLLGGTSNMMKQVVKKAAE